MAESPSDTPRETGEPTRVPDEARPAKRRRPRRIATVILLVLAVLLFTLAVPGAWVRRTLADSDRYVAMVAPLSRDPAVQEYLARVVTNQVFDALGVEERLKAALAERAPKLVFLAGPISDAVHGFVAEKVQAIFASEAFSAYWEQANRFVHTQLIAALRGEGGALVISDGRVVLSLLPLVNQGLQAVSSVMTDLLGRPIDLPELTGDEVPIEAVARIEQALGVDLPDRFGTVTVYDSEELAAVQDAVDRAGRLITLIVVLFVLAAAGALWLSTRRRRTLVQLTTALTVVLVIERRFAIAAANRVVDGAKPENRDAAKAVVDQVLGTLLRFTGWLLVLAVVTLVVALLTGPYSWAVRLRGWVRDIAAAVTGAVGRGEGVPAAAWISGHRDALMIGGAGVFVLVFLVANLTLGWFLLVALLLGAFELMVYRVGAAAPSA